MSGRDRNLLGSRVATSGCSRLPLPLLVDLDGRLSALKVGADPGRRNGDSLFGCTMFRWHGARRARLCWALADILVDIARYEGVLVLVIWFIEDYTSLCACRCGGRLFFSGLAAASRSCMGSLEDLPASTALLVRFPNTAIAFCCFRVM